MISMNYGSSPNSWKPWRWVRLDLIFMMRDIYMCMCVYTYTYTYTYTYIYMYVCIYIYIYIHIYIYINSNLNPPTKFNSSSRSTQFKDILPWNISQMIISNDHDHLSETIPISTRILISYAMKQSISFQVWWKADKDWDNNIIRISNGEKAIVVQILASEGINPKVRDCEGHSQGSKLEI